MDPFWAAVIFVVGGWSGMVLMAVMSVASRTTEETHSLRVDPNAMNLDRQVNQGDEDHARH
jgi:hypothetical protein